MQIFGVLHNRTSIASCQAARKVTRSSTSTRLPFRTSWIVALCVATSMTGYGQNIQGSIVGEITDTSGAAVAGTQITVTNQDTGISVQATTGSGGTYWVPDLYAGNYEIEVTKEGFESARITGIKVLAGQIVRQNLVLHVSSIRQSITVSGQAPLVNTEGGQISGDITTRQLKDLPVSLQSIDTYLTLVPGAQTIRTPSNPKTGGAMYWGGTNFNVNGVSANDTVNGRGAYGLSTGMVALPPISSMQEFKVNVTDANAEYRMQATVDMVTKQGTNKFHGGAYEYNQNSALAANTFLLNAAGKPKSRFNLNQFGGNLGGPIWRNKAFFFFSYAGFRQRQFSTVRQTFPSVEMRQGDFSALCASFEASGVCQDPKGTQLYDPWTGEPLPNNQIPGNMITSQAKTLLTFLPAPTTPGSPGLPNRSPNYFGVVSSPRDFNAYDLRVDWQLSSKDSLTGFYSRNVASQWFVPLGTPPNYGNIANAGYKTFIYQISETHAFNSNTINDFRVGWFNFPQIRTGQNLNFDPVQLFAQQPESEQRGIPKVNLKGYNGMGDYGRGFYFHAPDVEIVENLTRVRGRHTLKAGVDFTFYQLLTPNPVASLPGFSFSGNWTGNQGWPGQPHSQGNAFADFLLGAADSSSTSLPGHDTKYYDRDWEFYVQDTWQATPRLTVYYGIRYTFQEPWRVRDNLRSYYNRSTNQLALPENSDTPKFPPFGASAGAFNAFLPFLTTTKALGLPVNFDQPDKNNWGPRIGLALRPFSNVKTVLRTGYGVYHAFIPNALSVQSEASNVPWTGRAGSALNFISSLPGNPTSPFLPDVTFADPFPSAAGGEVVSAHPTLFPVQRDLANPLTQSWNLTLERQVGNDQMLRMSYVGAQSRHMLWYLADINRPTQQTPNVTIQNQRPIQPWSAMLATESGAKQNFHQLQLEFTRRFSNGLGAQAEYQWTRSLTNADEVGGPQIPAFPNLDYGNTSYVARHQLVFNYIYELPFGRGRHWWANLNSVAERFLGGWQLAGITTYRTGTPFTVNFQVPSSFVGWWGGRADRVPGSKLYAGRQTGHNVISGVQWFNPGAFAPPPPWNWGNSSPFSVWGPGMWDWDMSVGKSFHLPIRGLEASQLQFRADFFDAFNHFNLANPSNTIGDTRDGGPTVPTAGKIFDGTGNRIIQIGLSLYF